MPKIYIGETSKPNLKLLEEIVAGIIIKFTDATYSAEAAKKIIRVFLVPENSLNTLKK
jgi:hypothetical protein